MAMSGRFEISIQESAVGCRSERIELMSGYGNAVTERNIRPVSFQRYNIACGKLDRMTRLSEPMRRCKSDIGAGAENRRRDLSS